MILLLVVAFVAFSLGVLLGAFLSYGKAEEYL